MHKFFLVNLVIALSIFGKGYGVDKMNPIQNNYGFQRYGNETVDAVRVNGSVVLEGTTVTGEVQVNGSLEASHADVNSLHINGGVTLNQCTIHNQGFINGSCNATQTNFQKDLSIATQKITLNQCTLGSITVREMIGFQGTQIVDLRNNTHVIGSIVVEAGNGEVWISANSSVAGTITGATVVKK